MTRRARRKQSRLGCYRNWKVFAADPLSALVPLGPQSQCREKRRTTPRPVFAPLASQIHSLYSHHLKHLTPCSAAFQSAMKWGRGGAEEEGPWMTSRGWCHTLPPRKHCSVLAPHPRPVHLPLSQRDPHSRRPVRPPPPELTGGALAAPAT